jgi:hypothetical protein
VTLPDGKVKKYYYQALKVTGGKAAYTWTATGALPPGLKLAAGGSISGTPTTAGSYTFTLHVSDNGTPTNTASQTLTITISP